MTCQEGKNTLYTLEKKATGNATQIFCVCARYTVVKLFTEESSSDCLSSLIDSKNVIYIFYFWDPLFTC